MPKFEQVSILEARRKVASGKRQEVINEYIEYVEKLSPGGAGKLVPGAGESRAAVRRRLGDAMRITGTNLEIKTADDSVYFWIKPRRGRKPSNPAS